MSIRTLIFVIILLLSSIVLAEKIIPSVHVVSHYSITNGPQQLINKKNIIESGATTIAQVLQYQGGVQLQNASGNDRQTALGLRGFGANASSNTLLLINGIPITNPDMSPPDLNAIPLKDIKSIEIIAGSESVLYGDQAVGGVINLFTQTTQKERLNLACTLGSYHAVNCRAAVANYYRNLNYFFNFTQQKTDNYREHNHDDEHHFAGNFYYPFASGNIHADYQIGIENMQFPGALTTQQVRANRQQASNATDYFKNWNGLFHLNLLKNLNSDWLIDTDFSRRMMHGSGVLSSQFSQGRTINFIKPTLKGSWKNIFITTGADAQTDSYQLNSNFGNNANLQQKYGVFGLMNLPVRAPLFLSLGARGALQENHLTSFNSSNHLNRAAATTIGIKWKLKHGYQFYLRRAGSFRFPKADENASAGSGIANLRTQRGASYETGFELNQSYFSGNINLYQLNLRDEIAFDPLQTSTQPFGSNRNLAPTIRRGFSLAGHKNLTEKTTLNAQYNYVNARFQHGENSGNRIPLVAENIILSGLNYRINEHFSTYVEGLFTGNQYAANDDQNISGKLGGYTIFNINLHYFYENFTADFRINNIFNKEFYLYSVYQSSVNTDYFYPAPTRNVSLSLAYLFA